jgi:hypothetical protein
MARQYLADDGVLEPSIADPLAANAATTAVGIHGTNSFQYILIPAFDARPGKVYQLEAGGLITTAATGTLTISPSIGTSGTAAGTTLGASIAQTVPASSLSGPWFMKMKLVCTATGAPGANSTMKAWGWFISGGVAATANSGLQVTFGGTPAAFDHSVNNTIWISKTLSVAGSWTTQYIDLSAMN